jgi:hypothetical protein
VGPHGIGGWVGPIVQEAGWDPIVQEAGWAPLYRRLGGPHYTGGWVGPHGIGGWVGPHYIGGWVGPRAGLDGCGKCRPLRLFFSVFSLTLYFIRTCFFVLIILYFAFLYLLTTQTSLSPAVFEPATPASDRP